MQPVPHLRFKRCMSLLNRQENSSRKRTSISKNNRQFLPRRR
ncbi:conserved hypothetical protein [Burkholderia multivorans CGD1]|nr:conserved hypothetical protein [Burkholderia multivorans CGD1]